MILAEVCPLIVFYVINKLLSEYTVYVTLQAILTEDSSAFGRHQDSRRAAWKPLNCLLVVLIVEQLNPKLHP